MKRRKYYRSNDFTRNNQNDYRRLPARYQNGPRYYNYVPRSHHHWVIFALVIILCLGLSWFAADYWLNDNSSAPKTTVNKTVVNKNNSNQAAPAKQPRQAHPVQQPNVSKLEKEMNRLDVNEKDQATAINFYEKQNPKNQLKMNKMISIVNKAIPSDVLKRKILSWILS